MSHSEILEWVQQLSRPSIALTSAEVRRVHRLCVVVEECLRTLLLTFCWGHKVRRSLFHIRRMPHRKLRVSDTMLSSATKHFGGADFALAIICWIVSSACRLEDPNVFCFVHRGGLATRLLGPTTLLKLRSSCTRGSMVIILCRCSMWYWMERFFCIERGAVSLPSAIACSCDEFHERGGSGNFLKCVRGFWLPCA